MGRGYWVWLIPIAPDNTSVGIVADESIHPFEQYRTFEGALQWLSHNEPLIAAALKGRTILDFKKLKNYSFSSRQILSLKRWACVGEAAVFADPYYSVGSNMIAFTNGFTERLIQMDYEGVLTEEYVDFANRFLLTLNDALTDTIHRTYPYHHDAAVMALKTIWDYYIGWCTTDPQFYHDCYLDVKLSAVISSIISPSIVTHARMLTLFEEWGSQGSGLTFDFIDYIEDLPTLRELHIQMLPSEKKDFHVFLRKLRNAIARIEEVAQVIFFLAVGDLFPDQLKQFEERPWINSTAISLRPEQWTKDGLFAPRSKPRDLTALTREISQLFRRKSTAVES